MSENKVQYAGFWRRALAGLIDFAILNVVAYFLAAIISYILYYSFTGKGYCCFEQYNFDKNYDIFYHHKDVFLTQLFLYTIILSVVCAVFLVTKWQATPGKRLMKIYVVHMSGNKISFVRAILRTSLPLLIICIFASVFFMLLIKMNYQSSHMEDVELETVEALLPNTYKKFGSSESFAFKVTLIMLKLNDFYLDEGKKYGSDDDAIIVKSFERKNVNIEELVNNITRGGGAFITEDDTELIRLSLNEFLSFGKEKQLETQKKIFNVMRAEYLHKTNMLFFINLLVFFICLFTWYIVIVFTKEKTAMHDIIANTRVIKGRA
ncbi:MAG: RDD family protein [Rickettsiales bacterium]|nr:RDD family protein [Pseudomonadota bacterium]MDA0966740.1 RDD family protein [Pseudomonadota bacterium]MDG4543412.1 RDD family protein [Rickettsiales bacterium]MDG4546194.1 RDD family protein [Rickettsiales bacterium]MDG4547667.1 RDD family protein [Rickettsiales bacterium]